MVFYRYASIFLLIIAPLLIFTARANAGFLSMATIGNPTPDCHGNFPTIFFDGEFFFGENGVVSIIAPSSEPGVSRPVYLFGTTQDRVIPDGVEVYGQMAYIELGEGTAAFTLPSDAQGIAQLTIPLIGDLSLVGQQFFFQAVSIDPTCPGLSALSTSSARGIMIQGPTITNPEN